MGDRYSTLEPLETPPEPEKKADEPTQEPQQPRSDGAVPMARFNEVYAQWKAKERENAELASRLEAVEQKLNSGQPEPEPDVTEDPAAWKAWYAKQNAPAQPRQTTPQQSSPPPREELLAETARMIWPDYDQVVESQLPKMDAATQQRIMQSKNPPAEVYRWAKSQIESRQEAKENLTFEGGSLEGDAFFERDGQLTPEEKGIADRFGMTEKEWRGHKKAISKDRARMFGGNKGW